jgi:hypothetical protein
MKSLLRREAPDILCGVSKKHASLRRVAPREVESNLIRRLGGADFPGSGNPAAAGRFLNRPQGISRGGKSGSSLNSI